MAETIPHSESQIPYTFQTLRRLGGTVTGVSPHMDSLGALQEELTRWAVVTNAVRAVRAYSDIDGPETKIVPGREYAEPPNEYRLLQDSEPDKEEAFIAEIVTRRPVSNGNIPGGKFLLLHQRLDSQVVQTAQLPIDPETDELLIGGDHDLAFTVWQTCTSDEALNMKSVNNPADAAAIIGTLVGALATSIEGRTPEIV